MPERCIAVLLASALACHGCYLSHAASADAGSGLDDGTGDDTAEAVDDDGGLDGRYPFRDAWDEIGCTDADCPDGMVRVPCGPFVQGSRAGTGRTPADEPARVAWLSTYCIDRTEVTVSDYFECVAAGTCEGIDMTCNPVLSSSVPIRCVNDGQAERYCTWRHRPGGARLPTGAEWEKAARGGCEVVAPADCGPEDERRYPWGNDPPSCSRANFAGCGGAPMRAGDAPAGASPYGLLDLAGNVAEFVWGDSIDIMSDRTFCHCAPHPEDPCVAPNCPGLTLRGGHYESLADGITVADRGPVYFYEEPPEHIGFRCATSPF